MTMRILKESRLLLPGFLGTCCLIAAPYLILRREAPSFAIFGYALGCVVMAGLSMGQEFHYRTMAVLLTQPVPRARLWREKMVVLGVALLVITLLMGVTRLLLPTDQEVSAAEAWLGFPLVPLCAFCGGPWLTLLSRNGIAGAVSSLAFPAALMALSALVLSWFPQVREAALLYVNVGLLMIYCAAAYLLGRRAFRDFEAVEGGGRVVSLPDRLAGMSRLRKAFVRGPFSNLVWKEVRLQQVTFLTAGVFTVLALTGAGLKLIWKDAGTTLLAADFFIYVLMTPFLAGAVGVAEERSLGVTDWHLALPPSTAKQWLAKAGSVMLVSSILGAVLPLALLDAGMILFGGEMLHREMTLDFAILLIVGQIFLTALALHASSLCRSTLKAIVVGFGMAAAVGGCLRIVFLFADPLRITAQGRPDWTPLSLGALGLVTVLLWLGYLNFRGRSSAGGIAQAAGFLVLLVAVFALLV